MAMIGFNFTKISVERKKPSVQNVSITSNLGITDVTEIAFPVDDKKSAIRFTFHHSCKYEPDFAVIDIEGELIDLQDKDFAKKLLADWKANKKISPEIMTYVLNTALLKANIEAIVLSRDMNLPTPVPMPKIESKPAEEKSDNKSKKK